MAVTKYLQKDAILELTNETLLNRQAINRVTTKFNTGGATASVVKEDIPSLMAKPANEIITSYADMTAENTRKFAIDDEGHTYIFIYDAALQGSDSDKQKQWHRINEGISQAEADARYLQIGVQEFAPTFKLGQGGFGTQWAVGHPLIATMKNGQEFIIDFDPNNITTVSGWDPMATSNDTSGFFVVPDIDALNVADNPLVPLPAGGGAYTLPTLRDGANAFLLPKFRTNYKANTFRFKKNLVAGKTEATATWDDWTYDFVKLEPKVVPVKVLTKKYNSWADLVAEKDEIISIGLGVKAQIDWYGAAIRKDAFLPFMPFFTVDSSVYGSMSMSNNVEYKSKADNNGVTLYNQGTQVGSGTAGTIGWDKFDIYGTVLVGNALTSAGGSGMLMGQLSDVYDLENGRGVAHSVDKVLNIENIAELVKDQRDIDKQFLAQFQDHIYFTDINNAVPAIGHFQYVDAEIQDHTVNNIRIPMANYEVRKNGNSVTYVGAGVDPFARIEQEQANFKLTFGKPTTTVTYHFTTTGKQIRFRGTNVNDWYQWEMFGKFENNTRLMYVRFSASSGVTIETSDDGTNWTSRHQLYEAHPTDFQANTSAGKLAEVTFDFGASFPTPGARVKVATIDYLTATVFVEKRLSTIIEQVEEKATWLEGQINAKPTIENTSTPAGVLEPEKGKLVMAKAALASPHKVHYYEVDNNLAGVNVGTSHAGKLLRVKADGTLEYVSTQDVAITFDDKSTETWEVIKK